ncbi:MAG TPA: STAS domain-containing protein [Acidimicrobiales bacterium]|nr:STAS domain-containing protein [Acidimicrobiales bacterium]
MTAATYEGTAVLHLQGELDAETRARLRADLHPAVGQSAVLLDLQGASALEPAGVEVLARFIHDVHAAGGLAAVAGGPGVRRALRAGGLDRHVFVTDSGARALSWLADPANRRGSHARSRPSAIPTDANEFSA